MEKINKKKIGIIGTNGLPGRYGGWDQLLNNITINLRDRFSFIVYTSYFNAEKGVTEVNGAKLKIIKLKANGIQSIPYDIISMIHAVFKSDLLLVLGTSGCVFLPVIKLFSSKKIILNPDGAEWKRGKWNGFAKWFLKLSEEMGVKYSDVVIADNKIIQQYIFDYYGVNSELIEYGGDNARYTPISDATLLKYDLEINKYCFKVCRIEPENNIHLILESFSELDCKLIIIGNWNYSEYGKKLKLKYDKYRQFSLLDPIYEQNTLDELRSNCGLYIHGHSVGGTNPSLVEAMNLGLCCVVYNVDYNVETTENSALYFQSKEDLKKIITNFHDNKINVDLYRYKMNEIAKRRYSWNIIIKKYEKLLQLE
jgi:glycosyltransferase involved in cell wall biosynthesis